MEPIRISERVDLGGGLSVSVKELTLTEVRQWLFDGERVKACGENPNIDQAMEALFMPGVNLQDVYRMSDLTPDVAKGLTHSSFAKIMEACKRLNPPFFGILDALEKAGAVHSILATTQGNIAGGANP